jgi:2-C-methyl-D-erythritol 4-phosphate cytidylyltransferase
MANFSVILCTVAPEGVVGDNNGHFAKVDQREVLLRTVELFLNRENIKQILVVFTPEAAEESKRKFGPHLSFTGVKAATGGPRWVDQMVAAAEKISPDATHVIVHDAARPCLPYSDLDELMAEAEKSAAVCLAAPLRAALFQVDASGAPLAVCPMGDYLQMLAPRVFSKAKFEEIVKAKAEPHGSVYKIVKGSALNIRFGSGDAGLCKAALTMMPKPKAKPLTSPFDEAQW